MLKIKIGVFSYVKEEIRKFRCNYVPLWVLFSKLSMKGVCLRKRWGKWYRTCIVKLNFLAFIELISTFYYAHL